MRSTACRGPRACAHLARQHQGLVQGRAALVEQQHKLLEPPAVGQPLLLGLGVLALGCPGRRDPVQDGG